MTSSATDRGAASAGARAIAPILLGVIPFGLVAGIAAIDAGLRPVDAQAFSVIVFAGAAQLAALDLIGDDAPLLVIVGTALIINLRFAMYSASLAPHLASASRGSRSLAAYLLTDQAYAVSLARFGSGDLTPRARLRYYLGAAGIMWLTWQIATAVGALAGRAVPDAVPLGFAVPLAFLSLLVPNVTDRPQLVAALVSATVAVVAAPLPARLGMPTAAIVGIAAGYAASRRGGRA